MDRDTTKTLRQEETRRFIADGLATNARMCEFFVVSWFVSSYFVLAIVLVRVVLVRVVVVRVTTNQQ